MPRCRSSGLPKCGNVVPWHPMAPPAAFRCLSSLPMKCRIAEVQNVEMLQCHPNYAFPGGCASDSSKSKVSKKILIEKHPITYQKHLALNLPSAGSRRPSPFYQGYMNIYIQIHCFALVFSKRNSLPIQHIFLPFVFNTQLNLL